MISYDICLWLTSLTMIISVSIHVNAVALFHRDYYLWLSNISIVYMYHVFIRSSVDGRLDYFHVLANINSEHTGTCIFSSYSFPQTYTQEWDY